MAARRQAAARRRIKAEMRAAPSSALGATICRPAGGATGRRFSHTAVERHQRSTRSTALPAAAAGRGARVHARRGCGAGLVTARYPRAIETSSELDASGQLASPTMASWQHLLRLFRLDTAGASLAAVCLRSVGS